MRYYFHCTDGRALIIDKDGRHIRSDADLERKARAAARRVMARLFIDASWSDWLVCVYNEGGEQVEVVGFPREQTARSAPPVRTRPAPLKVVPATLEACVA